MLLTNTAYIDARYSSPCSHELVLDMEEGGANPNLVNCHEKFKVLLRLGQGTCFLSLSKRHRMRYRARYERH